MLGDPCTSVWQFTDELTGLHWGQIWSLLQSRCVLSHLSYLPSPFSFGRPTPSAPEVPEPHQILSHPLSVQFNAKADREGAAPDRQSQESVGTLVILGASEDHTWWSSRDNETEIKVIIGTSSACTLMAVAFPGTLFLIFLF